MGIVSDFWRITPVCFVFVTCIIQVVHSGRQPYRKDNDDSIVYPGPTKGGTSNRYGEGPKSSIPDECKGQNFCTIKPRDYPEDKFNEYFKDLKPVVQPTLLLDTNELGNRQGDPNERDDCETTITAVSSASAFKDLLPQMYMDGYLADSLTLLFEETSHRINFDTKEQSCNHIDGLEYSEGKQNRTLEQCGAEGKKDHWKMEQNIPSVIGKDKLMMRASISKFSKQVEVPDECKLATLCETAIDYPTDLAIQLTSQPGRQVYVTDDYNKFEFNNPKVCGDEFGYQNIFPMAGRIGDTWYYIINFDDGPRQGMQGVTLCGEKRTCTSTIDTLGYNVKCEQFFTKRNFTVIDENESLAVKLFEVPTVCACNELSKQN